MKRTILAIPDSSPLISLGVADRLERAHSHFSGALYQFICLEYNELRG
jgi:hypothetical protein